MPVLDTSFLIALHSEDPAAIALLRQHREDALFVPDVVGAEFLTDWKEPEHRAKVLAALAEDFTLCTTDRRWIEVAAALRARLRAMGAAVRKVDVWIAAWALYHNTAVISRDVEDLSPLVDVITW